MRYYAYLLGALVPLGAIMVVAAIVSGPPVGVLGGLAAIAVGVAGFRWGGKEEAD